MSFILFINVLLRFVIFSLIEIMVSCCLFAEAITEIIYYEAENQIQSDLPRHVAINRQIPAKA